MQSKAATVAEYLASLPPDRREAIAAVRAVILKNLDKDYEEGMTYGMIGYYVPHSIFPAGYHCDPKQPLPFAGLASQKNHMAVYMMGLYCGDEDGTNTADARWFRDAWIKAGKKLDMGKACTRFKKLDDIAIDVIGEAIRRIPAKEFIRRYVKSREEMEALKQAIGKKTSKKAARPEKADSKPKAARKTTRVSKKSASVKSTTARKSPATKKKAPKK